MGFRIASTDVWGGRGRRGIFSSTQPICVLEGDTIPALFAAICTKQNCHRRRQQWKVAGPFEAPRPLTLCKCDCKKFITAICRGLHRHTMRNIHRSQRCISARQMTDNIFENIAIAHVACAPRESDILLTDFAAAHFFCAKT